MLPHFMWDRQGVRSNMQNALNVPKWKEAILEEMNAPKRNET